MLVFDLHRVRLAFVRCRIQGGDFNSQWEPYVTLEEELLFDLVRSSTLSSGNLSPRRGG